MAVFWKGIRRWKGRVESTTRLGVRVFWAACLAMAGDEAAGVDDSKRGEW
jgi:hypothetical protein